MDSGNIVVQEARGSPRIYLYTANTGHTLGKVLAQGLEAGRDFWNDAPTLTRILFCTMIDSLEGKTGYGISTQATREETELVVDVENQTVGEVTFEEWIKANT